MSAYGDDTTFNAWLAAHGYTLPSGSLTAAVLRERGSAYIDGVYGARFVGLPTGGWAQELQWPRTGATAYGQPIGDAVIPDAVIKASYAAAWQEATSPGSLSVSATAGRMVKRQKVGDIEREFFQAGSDLSAAEASVVLLSTVEGLLAPYLVATEFGPAILVV